MNVESIEKLYNYLSSPDAQLFAIVEGADRVFELQNINNFCKTMAEEEKQEASCV